MGVITIVLYTAVIIVAIFLIGLILIQQSKGGGGLGTTFGGAGEAVFGARAGNHLTKLTVILTTVFFVLILALAVLSGHKDRAKSVVELESSSNATVPVEQKVVPSTTNQDNASTGVAQPSTDAKEPSPSATENKK